MTELSPAAQLVADAFEKAWRLSDADPYECYIEPVGAALRAAADQVIEEVSPVEAILAIAAELEASE